MHETPRTAAPQNLKNETNPWKVGEALNLARSSAVKMHLRAGTISEREVGEEEGRGEGQQAGSSSDAEGAVGAW